MKRVVSTLLTLCLAASLPWLTGCASGGGGIGGTGSLLGQGGGIGGTGQLIGQSGGGIGGTGRDAGDVFRLNPLPAPGVGIPSSDPRVPGVPQVVQGSAPTAVSDAAAGASRPEPPVQVAATVPDTEPGAGAPAADPALAPAGERTDTQVPDAMIDMAPALINCPDMILIDPNCRAVP